SPEILIIDTRSAESFKSGHLKGAINLPDGAKFEQWLGNLVAPHEKFYLLADSSEKLDVMIRKAAKIGYEQFIEGAQVISGAAPAQSKDANAEEVKAHPEKFSILDIRNKEEVEGKPIFEESLNIPLGELRERAGEVPLDKPIVVHCAGGYRSAVGSSILEKTLEGKASVFDMGEAIKEM